MAARTPESAARALTASLRRATGSVTRDVLQVYREADAGTTQYLVTFPAGRSAITRTADGTGRFGLRVRLRFRAVAESGGWSVRTSGYRFGIEDSSGREILEFHWHPGGDGFAEPHLHIGHAAAERIRPELQKAHIPTGIVVVEDFILLAVREFEIRAVPDVERILAETRAEATAAAEYSTSIR